MTDQEQDILLGRLAVHYKLLTKEQAQEAVQLWRVAQTGQDLGAFLVQRNYMAADVLPKLLRARSEYLRRNEDKTSAAPPRSVASPLSGAFPLAPETVTPEPSAPALADSNPAMQTVALPSPVQPAAPPEGAQTVVMSVQTMEVSVPAPPAAGAQTVVMPAEGLPPPPAEGAQTVVMPAGGFTPPPPAEGAQTVVMPAVGLPTPEEFPAEGAPTVAVPSPFQEATPPPAVPEPVAGAMTVRLDSNIVAAAAADGMAPLPTPAVPHITPEPLVPTPVETSIFEPVAPEPIAVEAVAVDGIDAEAMTVIPVPAEALGYAPGVGLADLLRRAAELGASDLHLRRSAADGQSVLELSAHGEPLASASPPHSSPEVLPQNDARELILALLAEEKRPYLEVQRHLAFAYSIPGVGRFRVRAYYHGDALCASCRVLSAEEEPFWDHLGLPESLKHLPESDRGLVLFTGPAGCGKSSTLAAAVRQINQRRTGRILTVEDPVEHTYLPASCVINQRERAPGESFAQVIEAARREAPDVLVIGELRGQGTFYPALATAAEGRPVFATLYASDTMAAVEQLAASFPGLAADGLRAAVGQRLVARADGNGHVAAFELLLVNEAVRTLIREGRTPDVRAILETGDDGMFTLDTALAALVSDGVITREAARRQALQPWKLG